MDENPRRVLGPFLGTRGLIFTTCLYQIHAHIVHTHLYTMECINNCREQLSYFTMRMFMCGWIMGIAMGWLGLLIEYFAGIAKKTTLKPSNYQGQSAVLSL